tara:strand:- start:552 stop:950 length:399 start_codon:yes stop_codon:yes gene_type:complete
MKKTILLIALLFSVAMFSQDYQGLWADTQVKDNYVAISYNEKNGYEFTNFSFAGNNVIKEEVLSIKKDLIFIYDGENWKDVDTFSIKTKIKNTNIENWVVYAQYNFVDKNIVEVLYTGDYHATHNLIKKEIN